MNVVYVVMREPEDVWAQEVEAVFTSKEKAQEYAVAANALNKSRKHSMFHYWVDDAYDIELDPKPWGEIE